MYKNRQEIAAVLLKKYFNDASLVVAQAESVSTLIEKEMDPAIVVSLKTLCAIYEDNLSVFETNDFFFKLSQSTPFKKIFEDLWDEVFNGLDILEKSVLVDHITAKPIYRPVVISSTGNTYDYSTLVSCWKGQSGLTDPGTKEQVRDSVIPNLLAYRQVMAWYEQRGLKLIWEDKANQAGSRTWSSIYPGISVVYPTIQHDMPRQMPPAAVMTIQTKTVNVAPSKYTFYPQAISSASYLHRATPAMSSINVQQQFIPNVCPQKTVRESAEIISGLKEAHAREKTANTEEDVGSFGYFPE